MKQYISFILLMLAISGCEINQKDLKPEDEFVKIYNDPDEQLAYYPLSLVQTNDRGFIILAAIKYDSSLSEYPTAAIIRTNATGEVQNTVKTSWLAPVPRITQVDGNVSFIAMDSQSKASMISVNSTDGEIAGNTSLDLTMPLYSLTDEQNRIVVLGYNYVSRASIVALLSSTGSLINRTELNVNTDLISQIQTHMNKTGSELPFFIGEWQNETESGYFVNCLANYTLRTVFFNTSLATTGGDIYSFQARDALSSLINISGNNYAFTRYYGSQNYISSNVEVNPNSSQNFNELTQNKLDELVPSAKVVSRKVLFNNNEYMLFASSTNSNSIVVYQYSVDNPEELLHTEYFDFENKIEISDMIQDSFDDGIVVLGKIYLTGRFQRPIVVKFKKDEFNN